MENMKISAIFGPELRTNQIITEPKQDSFSEGDSRSCIQYISRIFET
jgi:hypothetical protein